MKLLPAHVLKLMNRADRARLGKAGRTPEDIEALVHHRLEADLQGQICEWLRMREVEYIKPDMRKRSRMPPGWPDFTFAWRGVPCGVECKVRDEEPTQEQRTQHARMAANGWRIVVARTLMDVIELTRRVDDFARGL